jgi:glycosyltransferase involved in cell wall biosynthesis
MRIVLFSRHYSGVVGGIERLSLEIAQVLIDAGHDVHLISFDKPKSNMFFPSPQDMKWHQLDFEDTGASATWNQRIRRIHSIRKKVKEIKPDVFIVFQVGSFALFRIAVSGLGIRGIAAERNAPTLFKFIRRGYSKYLFYQFVLSFATVIAVQFEQYRSLYSIHLRRKIVVTPNIVSIHKPREPRMAIGGELKVLYIGRLTFQKNVFVLIEAISLVQNRKVSLTIVGEGPDLNALKSLTQSLNVDAVFHNFQENLTPYFTNSDVLCLPSRWEGFPNVIAEAMSHGMPAIGFKDCAGVSSLIKSKVNGELVDGIDSAESLSFVLSAFEVADYLPSEIQKSVEVFDRALFSSQWQKAVDASVYHRRK